VAVANARLHEELALRSREIEEQNKQLERSARAKERELERLRVRVEEQELAIGTRYDYSNIIGKSPPMRRLFAQLDRIVGSEVSVLIQGESGTGKELVARAIHANSQRGKRAFVAVNCAALPETLLESELFGHQRGAFTGADRDKLGLMRSAEGGTLFLDEIGEMSLVTQAKLLRVLQEREVRPLGSPRSVPIDIRLVAATHRDLAADVQSGRFREDLFYRVAVVNLALPALRERVQDLPELSQVILARLGREASRAAPRLTPEALRALAAHPFPGNVRELENVLTRAFVLGSEARIAAADLGLLPPARRRASGVSRAEFEAEERARILETLYSVRWNVSEASRLLGVPRNTLYRRLERYGLAREMEPSA
jgi:transcriptional regulator with PAS, ATPase and Fis domain